jgi:hypothetical protein
MSTEHKQLMVMSVQYLTCDLVAAVYNQRIGSLEWENSTQHGHRTILKTSVNTASMTIGIAPWVIKLAIGCKHP